MDSETSFTADIALDVLQQVCADAGLDTREAELLGPIGDNAVWRLPLEGIVARIAWSTDALPSVRRELGVAAWLAKQDFPAVRVAACREQPLIHRGRVVTFWEEIPKPQQASTAEMGTLLKRLHALPCPDDGLLTPYDPFARQLSHIDEATGISTEERAFLRTRLTELQNAHASLNFALPPAVIHGDAHRKNIVRAADGQVMLLDLERFSTGHPEWDLTVPAVYRRVGWYDDATYAAFAHAYGLDVTEWSGFPVLAQIRELRMTTWLASRTGREPRLIPEALHRIATLRDPALPRRWSPGT
ncbi:aminoglycoside phosphotransferase family protein [Spongiactinospora gelatinilytica]|uniref:Aminoglycoside phosphotransferase family protein n=1 Tax=Spongiactinospora gelatinilytica TaxID=2666298 RepID=A0A2W2H4Y2_9ACTN|nr:aminoglycoside phosphotransferase family protein [Spongiactinospora gelatinilytica]PZG45040.1 aminoglycoside phosphotransferase family protein [Spongiactinospora gelatinilytica]